MLYSMFGTTFVNAAILFFLAAWLWPNGVSVTSGNATMFSTILWLVTTCHGMIIEHISLRLETVTTLYLIGITLAAAALQGWVLAWAPPAALATY